jgi:DNA mismatch repair protein MutL
VRKRFLKREGSEGGFCRQAFVDKALAFPGIGFHFIQEGKLKTLVPPDTSFKDRFAALLLNSGEKPFVHEIFAAGSGVSVTIVAGGPELYRSDRRRQYVFANGRRIQDFSLLQALEYGLQGWFPNGTHPVGAIYLEIDPKLADFNIHPAKREARFADPGAIHHAISSILLDFSRRRNVSPDGGTYPGNPLFPGEDFRTGKGLYDTGEALGRTGSSLVMEALLNGVPCFSPLPSGEGDRMAAENTLPYTPERVSPGIPPEDGASPSPVYAGRIFGLFILIEKGDRVFIIDQHAAHERILYDGFLAGSVPKQELLIAIPFTTGSEEEDRFLTKRREDLAKLGIVIEKDGEGWRIEALPVNWRMGDAETVKEILELRLAGENMAERWAATLSCHSAVKDGDYLDDTAALALGKAALGLPVPRCPHGRPVWVEISREFLFRQVRRI